MNIHSEKRVSALVLSGLRRGFVPHVGEPFPTPEEHIGGERTVAVFCAPPAAIVLLGSRCCYLTWRGAKNNELTKLKEIHSTTY